MRFSNDVCNCCSELYSWNPNRVQGNERLGKASYLWSLPRASYASSSSMASASSVQTSFFVHLSWEIIFNVFNNLFGRFNNWKQEWQRSFNCCHRWQFSHTAIFWFFCYEGSVFCSLFCHFLTRNLKMHLIDCGLPSGKIIEENLSLTTLENCIFTYEILCSIRRYNLFNASIACMRF